MTEDAAAFVVADRVVAYQQIKAVRVALTKWQVDAYTLPTTPAKASDTRSRRWTSETCQLEALAPSDLAEIVRDEIELELDLDAYDHQVELEQQDRSELLALPRGDE